MDQKGVADKIRRHHRAARPGLDRLLRRPTLFILSIFSRRCGSTKGPFFNDLAINQISSSSCDSRRSMMKRSLGLCLRARLKAFRELAPRADRMMTSAAALRFALATTHRVIDRVHDHAAHMRTAALPARASGFAARQHSCDRHCRPGRSSRKHVFVDPANFARRQFHQARNRLRGCSASPADRRCAQSVRRGPA